MARIRNDAGRPNRRRGGRGDGGGRPGGGVIKRARGLRKIRPPCNIRNTSPQDRAGAQDARAGAAPAAARAARAARHRRRQAQRRRTAPSRPRPGPGRRRPDAPGRPGAGRGTGHRRAGRRWPRRLRSSPASTSSTRPKYSKRRAGAAPAGSGAPALCPRSSSVSTSSPGCWPAAKANCETWHGRPTPKPLPGMDRPLLRAHRGRIRRRARGEVPRQRRADRSPPADHRHPLPSCPGHRRDVQVVDLAVLRSIQAGRLHHWRRCRPRRRSAGRSSSPGCGPRRAERTPGRGPAVLARGEVLQRS